jgi:hypothetical protein
VAHEDARNLGHVLQRRAAETSAEFIERNGVHAAAFHNAAATLEFAVMRALRVDGCICEFGVFEGRTLRMIETLASNRVLHGFDSFEGLPEDWRGDYQQGAFKTAVPRFDNPAVHLHIGWFEATVPPFVLELQGPIALAHIDCDLYSSTSTVLNSVLGNLIPGSILLFDEYFNYPGWQDHEHRALQEAIEKDWIQVDFIGYNQHGEQVVMEVKGGSRIGTNIHGVSAGHSHRPGRNMPL